MRIPRVRFMIRWMMVAVAVAALALAYVGWVFRDTFFHDFYFSWR